MSHGIYLVDSVSKEPLHTDHPHEIKGANYVVGGTTELSLSVTYNYAAIIQSVFQDEGLKWLNDQCAVYTIGPLQTAIGLLGDDSTDDYWEATEGNVKRALIQLLTLAQIRPDGVWVVE